jgi:hypothetical protein
MSTPTYISWGTGSGTAKATDIALFNPVGSVVSGIITTPTTSTSGDTFLCTATLTASGNYSVTEVGLFDSQLSSAVGSLANQVNPTDTTITVSGYNGFPGAFPFNVQVSTEVMTVTSGNGTNVFNVIRGANGSSKSTNIIPTFTPVVAPSGNMYVKSSFAGIGLQAGDSIRFNISVQFS